MATSGKPFQHQLSGLPAVRSASPSDLGYLASRGIHSKAESLVFVAERGGALVFSLSALPRAFESAVLRVRTAHIDTIANWSDYSPDEAFRDTLRLLDAAGYRLVTARRPESEHDTIASLQRAGFRAIECLVTLSLNLAPQERPMPAGVTVADCQDADACAEIARQVFTMDRFHADDEIENALADELKSQWARNSVLGRADRVFVTRSNGTVTGFNACLLNGDTAAIDLIGVSRDHQSRGLGRALTAAAIAHYAGKARRIVVGTQSSNAASLALYQSFGFRPETSAITLHAHLS